MRPIGVVAALPAEATALSGRRRCPDAPVDLGGSAVLRLCGIGPTRATAAAVELLELGCGALASFGTAGGLVDELSPGDLVLPREVRRPRSPPLPCDPAWGEALAARICAGLVVLRLPLVESVSVVGSSEAKRELAETSGACATDMESAAVAAVAAEAGLPFLAVRAVADPVDLAVPAAALAGIDARGRLRPLALLGALARRPAELADLLRLARSFSRARRSLRRVVRDTTVALCFPGN